MKKIIGLFVVMYMLCQISYAQDLMSTSTAVTTTLLASGLDTDSVKTTEKAVKPTTLEKEDGLTLYEKQGTFGKVMTWVVTGICLVILAFFMLMIIASL